MFLVFVYLLKELRQTTTATATRTETRDLMSRTMAVHVRYKSLYISLLSFAKQQREMTKFCVFRRTQITTAALSGIERWRYIFNWSKF